VVNEKKDEGKSSPIYGSLIRRKYNEEKSESPDIRRNTNKNTGVQFTLPSQIAQNLRNFDKSISPPKQKKRILKGREKVT